jgi:hypothetical protein
MLDERWHRCLRPAEWPLPAGADLATDIAAQAPQASGCGAVAHPRQQHRRPRATSRTAPPAAKSSPGSPGCLPLQDCSGFHQPRDRPGAAVPGWQSSAAAHRHIPLYRRHAPGYLPAPHSPVTCRPAGGGQRASFAARCDRARTWFPDGCNSRQPCRAARPFLLSACRTRAGTRTLTRSSRSPGPPRPGSTAARPSAPVPCTPRPPPAAAAPAPHLASTPPRSRRATERPLHDQPCAQPGRLSGPRQRRPGGPPRRHGAELRGV